MIVRSALALSPVSINTVVLRLFRAATGARFVVVGRLSNWQMRAWPVLSKRVGAFDGVNAFRWRKPARTGGFPYPPERVEAFINLPALLLLDGAQRTPLCHHRTPSPASSLPDRSQL